MAREALSEAVALAADASGRPPHRHGVEPLVTRFWATGDSDDESSIAEEIEEEQEVDDLVQADKELAAITTSNSGKPPLHKTPLTNKIMDAMIQRRRCGRPWQGPLPPPRVSPARTFGDELSKAWLSTKLPSSRKGTPTGLSPVFTGDAHKQEVRQAEALADAQNSKIKSQLQEPATLEATSKENQMHVASAVTVKECVGPEKVLIGLGRYVGLGQRRAW